MYFESVFIWCDYRMTCVMAIIREGSELESEQSQNGVKK